MKRFLLLMLPIILSLASCKKEYVTPNRTIVVNIPAGNWDVLQGGRSYTTTIDVLELDDYINERGGVLVYLSFGDRTYEQIPQVFNGDAYSYFTRPGEIVLELQRYNGLEVAYPPGNMTVKIVLVASDF